MLKGWEMVYYMLLYSLTAWNCLSWVRLIWGAGNSIPLPSMGCRNQLIWLTYVGHLRDDQCLPRCALVQSLEWGTQHGLKYKYMNIVITTQNLAGFHLKLHICQFHCFFHLVLLYWTPFTILSGPLSSSLKTSLWITSFPLSTMKLHQECGLKTVLSTSMAVIK